MKSILELTVDELNEIINTGRLPEGTDLNAIVGDPRLNKFIDKPHLLAKHILKGRGGSGKVEVGYKPSTVSMELRLRSLKLKEEELQLKKEKQSHGRDNFRKLTTIDERTRKIEDMIKDIRETVDRILGIIPPR